jgi:hypothetical protein
VCKQEGSKPAYPNSWKAIPLCKGEKHTVADKYYWDILVPAN